MKSSNETWSVKLPGSLEGAVAAAAREDGVSVEHYVTRAVARATGRSAAATKAFFDGRAAGAEIEEARRLLDRPGGAPPAPEDRLPEARRERAGEDSRIATGDSVA